MPKPKRPLSKPKPQSFKPARSKISYVLEAKYYQSVTNYLRLTRECLISEKKCFGDEPLKEEILPKEWEMPLVFCSHINGEVKYHKGIEEEFSFNLKTGVINIIFFGTNPCEVKEVALTKDSSPKDLQDDDISLEMLNAFANALAEWEAPYDSAFKDASVEVEKISRAIERNAKRHTSQAVGEPVASSQSSAAPAPFSITPTLLG